MPRYTAPIDLNDVERQALERLATEHRMAKAAIMRLGLRLLAGLPVPTWAMDEFREQLRALETVL